MSAIPSSDGLTFPRVTVIIPTFNSADTIAETIASVVRQGYDNWNLIVHDDGSADDTIPIVEKIVESGDGRIRLMTHPDGGNRGQAVATNRAVAASSSDYIARLDADDLWSPDLLSTLIAMLDAHPDAGMAWCLSEYFKRSGEGAVVSDAYEPRSRPDVYGEAPVMAFVQPAGLPDEPFRFEPRGMAERFVRTNHFHPVTGTTVVRRTAFETLGGYDDLRTGDDILLWLKLALRFPLLFSPKVMHFYRQHPRGISNQMQRAGTDIEHDVVYRRQLLRLVGREPALKDYRRAVAAQYHAILHSWAEQVGWFAGRWRIVRGLVATREARWRRLWAMPFDWFLPLPTARRVTRRMFRPRFPDLPDPTTQGRPLDPVTYR